MDGTSAIKPKAIIRQGTLDDMPACVALGKRMTAEVRYKDMPYDEEFTLANMKALVEGAGDALFFVVMDVDGHGIQGFFFGYLTPYRFCKDFYADEDLIYIAPEFRGGMAIAKMLHTFVTWATERNAREIFSSTHTGNDLDALYERLGFRKLGSNFQMTLRTGDVP